MVSDRLDDQQDASGFEEEATPDNSREVLAYYPARYLSLYEGLIAQLDYASSAEHKAHLLEIGRFKRTKLGLEFDSEGAIQTINEQDAHLIIFRNYIAQLQDNIIRGHIASNTKRSIEVCDLALEILSDYKTKFRQPLINNQQSIFPVLRKKGATVAELNAVEVIIEQINIVTTDFLSNLDFFKKSNVESEYSNRLISIDKAFFFASHFMESMVIHLFNIDGFKSLADRYKNGVLKLEDCLKGEMPTLEPLFMAAKKFAGKRYRDKAILPLDTLNTYEILDTSFLLMIANNFIDETWAHYNNDAISKGFPDYTQGRRNLLKGELTNILSSPGNGFMTLLNDAWFSFMSEMLSSEYLSIDSLGTISNLQKLKSLGNGEQYYRLLNSMARGFVTSELRRTILLDRLTGDLEDKIAETDDSFFLKQFYIDLQAELIFTLTKTAGAVVHGAERFDFGLLRGQIEPLLADEVIHDIKPNEVAESLFTLQQDNLNLFPIILDVKPDQTAHFTLNNGLEITFYEMIAFKDPDRVDFALYLRNTNKYGERHITRLRYAYYIEQDNNEDMITQFELATIDDPTIEPGSPLEKALAYLSVEMLKHYNKAQIDIKERKIQSMPTTKSGKPIPEPAKKISRPVAPGSEEKIRNLPGMKPSKNRSEIDEESNGNIDENNNAMPQFLGGSKRYIVNFDATTTAADLFTTYRTLGNLSQAQAVLDHINDYILEGKYRINRIKHLFNIYRLRVGDYRVMFKSDEDGSLNITDITIKDPKIYNPK